MGRNGALVVAVLVIPDICINLPGPVRLGTRDTMQGFVFAKLILKASYTRPDSAWEMDLEVAAKAYRDPPTVVLSSGKPVDCSPPWPRSHLVPWLLSVANEMIDAGYLDLDVLDVLDWLDATRTEGNVHQLVGLSWNEALNATVAWHEGLSKKRIMGPAPVAKKVLHTWKDGFKLYELTTAEELEVEGSHMGHCVDEWMLEDIRRGAMRILSLRDSKERPKVTVELGNNTETPEWVAVMQAQGPGNSPPADKHAFRVAAYLLEAIPNIDFCLGEEELASYAECLQIAAMLLTVPGDTRLSLQAPRLVGRQWGKNSVRLVPRRGKRPMLVIELIATTLDLNFPWMPQFSAAVGDRLRIVLTLNLLRRAGLEARWSPQDKDVVVVYREVLPPTGQEVATAILKARRRGPNNDQAWARVLRQLEGYQLAIKRQVQGSYGDRRKWSPRLWRMLEVTKSEHEAGLPIDPPGGAGLRNRRR